MTDLSLTLIKEIRATVFGAAAKVPGTLIGCFVCCSGIYTWAFPIPALEAITLCLAAIFFVTGILRLISAFQHRHFREWFWLVMSSAISILMGILIMNGYPESSLWLSGLLIAVELLLQCWSMLFLGLAPRSLTK